MFAARFHPVTRNSPGPSREIDLVLPRAERLACPTCRQNCKFKSTRCDAVPLSKQCHESWDIGIRECGMMLRFGKPGASGQYVLQIAFQRAGLSPSRSFRTVAQSSTASIRLRTRLAVSVFVGQIGSLRSSAS